MKRLLLTLFAACLLSPLCAQWFRTTTTIDCSQQGMYFSDPLNGIMTGGTTSGGVQTVYGNIFKTNDGGETWTEVF